MLCHHNTHFFVVTCMRIMLSWHRRSLTKHFQSELFADCEEEEEKTTPWDRRKNVQITDNSNYCQNRPNLQNHYLDIIINLHLNPHQCYTCISYHHLTHVSITYFFCLKNYWSFGVKIFWGEVIEFDIRLFYAIL